jgi:glycosyltransferase involved in cell wall biosynthesis
LRILILGNMANDGYSIAKPLWKMNIDVDLAANSSEFGMSLPEWEDGDISTDIDPYNTHRDDIKNTSLSGRIRYFDLLNKVKGRRKRLFSKAKAKINLIRMIREYDIVEVNSPYVIFSQFSGIPNVVYDPGWIRYFPYRNGFYDKLARRGYSKAKGVIITNPDTFSISDTLTYLDQQRIYFSPFAIDSEKYCPFPMEELRAKYINNNGILLFSPSRQIWCEKGNDKMIKAFARFVKIFPDSKLVAVDWSIDAQKSKDLVNSLHISDKVEWIKPVAKKQLIEYYNAADIILDQFILGSWGTATAEAMSCQKPVLMFYKEEYIQRAFGENPPILNSFSEDDIFSSLVKLAKDPDFRLSLGRKSREWIIKTHAPDIVAKNHFEILNQFVNR